MAAKILTGRQLAEREFDLIEIPEPWNETLGDIEQKAYALVWGTPGAGKSTLMLLLAQMLTRFGRVIYAAIEEGHSVTLQDKVRRMKAFDVELLETNDLAEIRGSAMKQGDEAAFIVVDSISEADPMSRAIEDLRTWCKEKKIGLWIIAHALKGGDNYKGPSHLAHGTDVVAKVVQDEESGKSVFMTTKNRYAATGPDSYMAVPFTVDDDGQIELRENPMGVSDGNPYVTTLAEAIDSNGNAKRWVSKLNEIVGFHHGCFTPKHGGSDPPQRAEVAFVDEKFGETKTRPKQTVVTMLIDGEFHDEICAPTSKEAIKEIKRRHGDLEIRITDEKHARAVLGAKEYRRQERLFAKNEEPKPGKPKPAKKSSSGGERAKLRQKQRAVWEDKPLPYEPKSFFDYNGQAVELDVDELVHDHRPTAAKTRTAEQRMRAAHAGDGAKRAPVEVRRRADGKYVVVDGNNTLKVARKWGWPKLPAIVEKTENDDLSAEDAAKFDAGMDRLEALMQEALK